MRPRDPGRSGASASAEKGVGRHVRSAFQPLVSGEEFDYVPPALLGARRPTGELKVWKTQRAISFPKWD
jgi:hypothetical protein